jgi:hypothetical protein
MKKAVKNNEYVFVRRNMGDAHNEPPIELTEDKAKMLLSVIYKDPQRAINRLKKGYTLETRFATYSARPV